MDIFFILLHYVLKFSITVLFNTGKGNKKRLINISRIAAGLTQEYCSALLALHAFAGCDSMSAFKGIWKVKPIKLLEKMPKSIPILSRVGNQWDIEEDIFIGLEEFTCAMYGKSQFCKVDERCGDDNILKVSKTIDSSLIPPCESYLRQHIRRVNYQVASWKVSH